VRDELTRAFGPEQRLLQRERKTGVAGWLWAAGYGVVLAIALAFLGALVWGVRRVSSAPGRPAEHEHVQQQRQRHRAHQQREPAPQQ
jgi:hypothetical protein